MRIKKVFLSVVIFFTVLIGYGYFHALTHGSFFLVLKSEKGILKSIPIEFLDAHEKLLAKGRTDDTYGIVSVENPVRGYCNPAESRLVYSVEESQRWRECFEEESKWVITWMDQAQFLRLKTPLCEAEVYPLKVVKTLSDWWIWWLPLPHSFGKPYSYYSLSIDSAALDKCF